MLLRSYSEKDLKEILALFYDAVHLVAAKDYSPAQLDAWAPRLPDEERWRNSLSAHYALVAEEGGKIVGFADIDGTGYLDRLYAAADFQRRGVGGALADALEKYAFERGAEKISTYASLTAKPFFEERGYVAEARRSVERRGERLTNFSMTKYF